MREDRVKVLLEVRKEPNITYIEGYNGTLLDPNKVTAAADDDNDKDEDDNNEDDDAKGKTLELSLTCTTESAKPPVTHNWFKIIGDEQIKLTPVNLELIPVNDNTGVTTTKSMVRLNLSPRDKVSRKLR